MHRTTTLLLILSIPVGLFAQEKPSLREAARRAAALLQLPNQPNGQSVRPIVVASLLAVPVVAQGQPDRADQAHRWAVRELPADEPGVKLIEVCYEPGVRSYDRVCRVVRQKVETPWALMTSSAAITMLVIFRESLALTSSKR